MGIKKEYYRNGNIREKIYYENDKKHRLDGPALIFYDKRGNIKEEIYCINDEMFDEFQYYVCAGSLK